MSRPVRPPTITTRTLRVELWRGVEHGFWQGVTISCSDRVSVLDVVAQVQRQAHSRPRLSLCVSGGCVWFLRDDG